MSENTNSGVEVCATNINEQLNSCFGLLYNRDADDDLRIGWIKCDWKNVLQYSSQLRSMIFYDSSVW